MAMRQCCDAYGTPKGVKRYRITICEVISAKEGAPDDKCVFAPVEHYGGVLCERGLKRAKGFLEHSFTAVSRTPADQTEEPKAKGDV